MDTLVALQQILLSSIPTFLLVWILYFFTSRVFLKPLQETLRKRHAATLGLREAAEANLALAEKKTAQYEEALRTARAESYQQQEQERQRALEQRAERVRQARQHAEEMISRARQEIRQDVAEAKTQLAAESEQIALSVTRAILEPSLAGPPSRAPGRPEAGR